MLYLIRHGEPASSWGDSDRDPGISELGKRQAEAVARTLQESGAIRAVTSPLARCRQTARPFEQLLETHARIDPGVGEVREPQGHPDRAAWLREVMQGTWPQAGEALDQWRKSVLSALERMPDNTAVFSHFVAINAVVSLLTGDDRVVVFKPAHCSVTQLSRVNGKLRVTQLGSEGALQLL